MNCSKCGTPLAEGSTVCGVCGAPVSPQSTVVPVAPEAPVTSNVEPNVSVAAPSAPVVTPEAPVAPVAPEVPVAPVAPEVPVVSEVPVAPVAPVVATSVANQTVTPEAPVVAPVTPAAPVVEMPVVPVTSEVVNQPIINQDFSQNPNGVVPPQGPGLQQQMMGTPVVPMQPQKKDNKFMIIIIAMLLVIVVLGVIAFGDKIGINVGKSNNNSGEVKKDDSNDKEDDKDDVVTRTIVKYTLSGIDVLITDDIKVYEQENGALLIGDNKTFQSLIQLLPGNIDELSTELNEVSNDLENSSDIITKTYGGYKTVYVSGTLEGNNVDFGIMDVDGTAVLMFCTKKTSKTNIDNVFEIYADIIDSIFATNNFNSNDSNIGNDITNDGSITDDVKFDDLEEE